MGQVPSPVEVDQPMEEEAYELALSVPVNVFTIGSPAEDFIAQWNILQWASLPNALMMFWRHSGPYGCCSG